MQNDFVPIHLKKANDDLDKHVLASKKEYKIDNKIDKHISLWDKFLKILKK